MDMPAGPALLITQSDNTTFLLLGTSDATFRNCLAADGVNFVFCVTEQLSSFDVVLYGGFAYTGIYFEVDSLQRVNSPGSSGSA